MTQANAPDAWDETFLITIQKKGGSALEFPAVITTYDVTGGEKPFSTLANGKGGRIKKFETQTDYEVVLEAYTLEHGTSTGSEGLGFTDLMNSVDTTQPISVSPDHTRDQYMLAIAHTTSTSATSAVAASAVGDRIVRDIFKNGHFVSVNTSFTDGIRKLTVRFKAAPFSKDASANVIMDSSDGSDTAVVPLINYA